MSLDSLARRDVLDPAVSKSVQMTVEVVNVNESKVVRGAVSFLEASLDWSTHRGVAGGEEVVGLALLGREDG